MQLKILFIFFILLPAAVSGQSSVDELIEEINFKGDTIGAVFEFVATNITYDTKFIEAPQQYHNHEEVLSEVLKSRKGVCMHYAALFHAICSRLGYSSYMISGYTKFMNQQPGKVPHAWNAVKINNEWFLFDATWASGTVIGKKFMPHYDKQWYKVKPEKFIYSHIPFDPIFQFLNNPVNHHEIKNNQYNPAGFMDFEKELMAYNGQSEIQRLENSLHRIQKSGVTNHLISNKVAYLKDQIEIHSHNQQVYSYSKIHQLLKYAKERYRHYTEAKKKQFKNYSEEEINAMLRSSAQDLQAAYDQLNSFKASNKYLQQSIEEKIQDSNELLAMVKEEEVFFEKYQRMWKPLRIFAFL